MPAPLRRVEVDGRRVAFRRAGSGPPLVLLHGALSDSRAWRRQLDRLADECTVVAWDAPGCGGSSDPPEGIGLDGYVDALAGLLDALGLERPHVCGLSFGGGLALALEQRRPGTARSLVLASAYAGWAGSLPPEEVDRRLARALEEADRPAEAWIDRWLAEIFGPGAPQAAVDEAAAMMRAARPEGTRAMLRAFAAADLRGGLGSIDAPTLLLYGDADRRSPVGGADDLRARIPRASLRLLPGVGHAVNLEAPDAFDAEVRAFLRSVDGRAA